MGQVGEWEVGKVNTPAGLHNRDLVAKSLAASRLLPTHQGVGSPARLCVMKCLCTVQATL